MIVASQQARVDAGPPGNTSARRAGADPLALRMTVGAVPRENEPIRGGADDAIAGAQIKPALGGEASLDKRPHTLLRRFIEVEQG